jgi:hypothetical protein
MATNSDAVNKAMSIEGVLKKKSPSMFKSW